MKKTTQIKKDVKALNEFFAQFEGRFVARDGILDRLKLALLCNQHLLVMGPPGTAKTAVGTQILENINGSRFFETELTKYMTDEGILGPYDVKKLRDHGLLEHNTSGMLPEADTARLGEFLDGNVATMRSLLSALNERKLKRGPQQINMPLLTAYADTNTDPAWFLRRNPDAWAVLDRFLFITSVDYVDNADDMAAIVKAFQTGIELPVKKHIDLDLVKRLSGVITGTPTLFTDQGIYLWYAKAQASQVAEISAMLDGRLTVTIDDLPMCYYALGSTESEKRLWEEICESIKKEYEDTKQRDLKIAQDHALSVIATHLSQVDVKTGDIKSLRSDLDVIHEQLSAVRPDDDDFI